MHEPGILDFGSNQKIFVTPTQSLSNRLTQVMAAMNNQGEDSPLPSHDETLHSHQQNQLQHQGMQQQSFVGFGIDPNWGGFSQMMHGQG